MPSEERVLKEGDIVSLDFGAIYKGFYGDAALTYPVGKISDEARKLLEVTEESLYKGIDEVREGDRLHDVSYAIQSFVEAEGFSVVREFVGHGIGRHLHEEPQIPNFGVRGHGRAAEERYGARHRAHDKRGRERHSNQGERMDCGDQGRKAFGPFRAYCCPYGQRGGDIERNMRVYA